MNKIAKAQEEMYEDIMKQDKLERKGSGDWIGATLVLDENGTHPVERYSTKIEATVGHKKWVKKTKSGIKVVK